jgi:hypothetical protein
MAKTGYKIINNVNQKFSSGPNSGSLAGLGDGFQINLGISPFSRSLNELEYFNRILNPETCEEGINTCIPPILTSLTTGSQRGYFNLNYVTESSLNAATSITASVSSASLFSSVQTFSSSMGSVLPITTSLVSGTVLFRAFTSCSGPQSPNSSLLSYTYDEIGPDFIKGDVTLNFTNTLSSPMEVRIRSLRGNSNNIVDALSTFTYDYVGSPVTGSYVSKRKSPDLVVTIKGGARSANGNQVLRVNNSGDNNLIFTTGSGFSSPLAENDTSVTFPPDEGVTFVIRQLDIPEQGSSSTSTFSLIQKGLNITETTDFDDRTLTPTIRFGSSPTTSSFAVCGDSSINPKEKTYYQLGGYIYNNLQDAETLTKPTFANNINYILVANNKYIAVNNKGFILEYENCSLPQFRIFNGLGAFSNQEEACKRDKSTISSQIFSYKDNQLTEEGRSISGRFPIDIPLKGGKNVIFSTGKIIGTETCGTELTPVLFGQTRYSNSLYPLETPELVNPEILNNICGDSRLITYYQGPSGLTYHQKEGNNAYRLVGDGTFWLRNEDGNYVLFNQGIIEKTISIC